MTDRRPKRSIRGRQGLQALRAADACWPRLLDGQQAAAAAVAPGASRDRRRRRRSPPMRSAPAAGSPMPAPAAPGLMALADALELPGTFGIPPDRTPMLFAGGAAALLHMTGAVEDDPALAAGRPRRAPGSAPGDVADLRLGQRHARPTRSRSRAAAQAPAAPRSIGIANVAGQPAAAAAPTSPSCWTPGRRWSPARPGWARRRRRRSRSTCSRRWSACVSAMSTTATWSTSSPTTPSCATAPRASSPRYRRGRRGRGRARRWRPTGGAVKPAVLIAAGAAPRHAAEPLLAASGGHLGPALADAAG